MSKSKNIDNIFEDLLDKDFVNLFKPCFFMQLLFGTLGVNIECKFITPPTNWYKVYCFVAWLVNTVCIVHAVIACETQSDALSTDIPLKEGIVLNGFVYTVLVWKSVFYRGNSRCQLYVKLQKIERSLKIRNVKRINGKLQTMAWAVVVASLILYTIWIVIFNKFLMYCPSATLATVVCTAIYFEIYHVITILWLISLRVQYVNSKLSQEKTDSQKEILFTTVDYFKATIDEIGDELVHGMFYILDSFADTMDIFPLAIFFFTFQMLAWQLITMQNLVVSYKMQMSVNIESFLCTLAYSLVFMVFMLMLCFISQSLMTKLDTCAELCTTLTFSLDEGKSRENAKRITLLLKGKRNATVFDIFRLDTQLPLHLLGITASYTIVLLQFAAL